MSNQRILIIDDDFPLRYLIENHLQRYNFEVKTARDGAAGLKKAQSYHPHLILLDVMMPDVNGFEVCKLIRSDPVLCDTPVIFLTACATKEHKLRAYQVGADDFMTKPFQGTELVAHIQAVLRRSKRQQTADLNPNLAVENGRSIAFFSPKGGVGTTTLAIQLSESLLLHEGKKVVLIDYHLPFGTIAQYLDLFADRSIRDLLAVPAADIELEQILHFAQQHRGDFYVIPAPGSFAVAKQSANAGQIEKICATLTAAGYYVVLDLGSTLTAEVVAAMHAVAHLFTVTSGAAIANRLHDAFVEKAVEMGIQSQLILPIVNEVHGPMEQIQLSRMAVARIPVTSESSRTRLWLREQAIQKMLTFLV